ncbi:1384_t:CDS:2 [Ambispora leptoticha]|uniref:1384_t:CDS:1 n=1 Tax=Ambispora leptoticha TaxID=144679 RepID=A0A9N9HWD3_9GLOM|nr:1384_t:CDS:2 [Ambispora leptoticha]
MNRVTNSPVTRQRRKDIVKEAKGGFGHQSGPFKTAKEHVMRARAYAYRDRKQKKRDFRPQIKLNRKQLSEMAIHQPQHFQALISKVQNP